MVLAASVLGVGEKCLVVEVPTAPLTCNQLALSDLVRVFNPVTSFILWYNCCNNTNKFKLVTVLGNLTMSDQHAFIYLKRMRDC